MKKEKTNKKEATRTVFIPRESKHDDAQYIAVNGRRMLVKKGENVALPVSFAAVVEASFSARREAESYIERVSAEG